MVHISRPFIKNSLVPAAVTSKQRNSLLTQSLLLSRIEPGVTGTKNATKSWGKAYTRLVFVRFLKNLQVVVLAMGRKVEHCYSNNLWLSLAVVLSYIIKELMRKICKTNIKVCAREREEDKYGAVARQWNVFHSANIKFNMRRHFGWWGKRCDSLPGNNASN